MRTERCEMSVDETEKDSRGSWRRRALKTGTIWFNNDNSTMHCQVRDLSFTGAKIRFLKEFACPKNIKLQIPGGELKGPVIRAERVWIRGREVGLHFIDGESFEMGPRVGLRRPIVEPAVLNTPSVPYSGTTNDISGSGALIENVGAGFNADKVDVVIEKVGKFGASVVRTGDEGIAVRFDHNEDDQNSLQKKLDEISSENDPGEA